MRRKSTHFAWTLGFVCLLGLFAATARSQETPVEPIWNPVQLKTTASLRGLHVFDENTIWASGSGGTIVNSFDGGEVWQEQIVEDARELDFRDIQALSAKTIVAMTSGTPARIYRSTDAGETGSGSTRMTIRLFFSTRSVFGMLVRAS